MRQGFINVRFKAVLDLLLTLALVYLGITAVMFLTQRSYMYFPQGLRPPPEELGMTRTIEARVTTEDGIQISGWYWQGEEKLPVIVFFHGNGQAYMHWMQKLEHFKSRGYGVLFAEYRGYGGNEGNPTEQGLYKDARAYIGWLKENYDVNAQNLVVYGESLGTGVAVQMASEFPVAGVVLESGFSSAADIGQFAYPFLPVKILMKDQYRSIDKIDRLRMPKLFLHGRADQTVPLRFAQKLYKAAPEPKIFELIDSGGHNDLYENNAALHVLDFLSNIAQSLPASRDSYLKSKE